MERPKVATNMVSSASNEPWMVVPHGLDEIIASFGGIHEYVGADGQLDSRWQVDFLERVSLPFFAPPVVGPVANYHPDDMPPAYDSCFFTRLRLHSRARTAGQDHEFWRCFAFRPQRTGSKLSTHSWGHRDLI